MDNYPQINLRRVLKGVDFGTFYKVVKSRPEILEVLTSYDFDNDQTKQILAAFVDGLTLEQIKSCATVEFDAAQMIVIYEAYLSGLTLEQMRLVLNPNFCALQMKWIIIGIQNGWEEKKIKLYAKTEFEPGQMEEIYNAIQDGLSIMKIRLFAKPEFTAAQMNEIRFAFSSFETHLTYRQVKAIANLKLSAEQISMLVWAYGIGLTIEQVEKIVKDNYTKEQMQEIIFAYSEEFTDEQMALILNPNLNEYQMNKIRDAIRDGISREVISIIATGEYDDELMEIIIGAYNYGVMSYVQVLLNPEFDVRQAEAIWEFCDEGILSLEQIKFIADPKNNYFKMKELSRWFMDYFSIEQVKLYADKFNAEQLEKIRYGLKNKLGFMDLWARPEFDECQMQEIICGIEKGFTKDQLLIYLNPQLSAYYMEFVRKDIEAGVPLEKVALYANCIDREIFEKTRIKVLYEEIQKLIKN